MRYHRGPPVMESNNKKRAVELKTTYNKDSNSAYTSMHARMGFLELVKCLQTLLCEYAVARKRRPAMTLSLMQHASAQPSHIFMLCAFTWYCDTRVHVT
eukprot:CAMPEP_0198230712 /NCGR_PEP_ID=MMETSP1445-20131203/114811_1 /TAXON_ID=36898 /ORGANISM="Pyramimonas sp., Strain CCMP2087" /LENGTH=98 /DNA_ID=CAMNT_0043911275 /DNA_START=852 /DNA_END=1148 /DNA_ORIENTATION=-